MQGIHPRLADRMVKIAGDAVAALHGEFARPNLPTLVVPERMKEAA